MAIGAETAIGTGELEKAVRAADPGARLVARRVLRRVIRHDRRLPLLGLQVPHRKVYVIAGAKAVELADREDLGLEPNEAPPETLILIARPDPDDLAATDRGQALVGCWRLLFHAKVHEAMDRRAAEGALDRTALRARIDRIGQVEFDEIREVLRHEQLLLPPRDDRTVYEEFAALYLELRHFAGTLIPTYFPGLHDLDAIDRLLAEDVDADALFSTTRPPGAPDPVVVEEPAEDDDEVEPGPGEEPPPGRRRASEPVFRVLMARADLASKRGNAVRAAMLRAKAVRVAPTGQIGRARDGAREELNRLAQRLGDALGLDDAHRRAWRRALPPLLERAAVGFWTAEARLLYDLQSTCIDHERPIYKVDLAAWARTFGRKPLKRLLPHQREVLMTKHLRSAQGRLGRVRLSERDRDRLAPLLRDAVHELEESLREQFRPLLSESLQRAGLVPDDLPERVALLGIIEELLDKIVEHGYLTMGDLRDAVSGNNLKVPDLAGVGELVHGDGILRANRLLAEVLDGVYHRGEFYLRWLQRFSALAFGTKAGRFLTLFVALPYGGAYVTLETLQHLISFVTHPLFGYHSHLLTPVSFAVVGTLALGLINWRAVRSISAKLLRWVYLALRGAFYDLPWWFLSRPLVRRVLDSRWFSFLARTLLIPAALTAIARAIMPGDARAELLGVSVQATIFLATSLLLNSKASRVLEESLVDAAARIWRRFSVNFLPALFHAVMDLFGRFLEAVDRVLYTVDEWLRFRGGQSRASLVFKAILGLVWAFVVYVVRIYVNLLIEPTFNPIKHFPTVTAAAKILLPFIGPVTRAIAQPLIPLVGSFAAHGIAGANFFLLPGLAGFLVWELKENWRLYEANRPPNLQPVVIGHHGETMIRLLRPGLHSGTVPKAFARLRRAERRGLRSGHWRAARKQRETIHHVAEAIARFVERDLVFLLRESGRPDLGPIDVGEVELTTNRARVALRCASCAQPLLRLAFDEQSGWLLSSVAEPGWLAELTPESRRTFATALAGLYKMAGVDLLREQIVASFDSVPIAYDISDAGLVVWPRDGSAAEAVYDLHNGPLLLPRVIDTDTTLTLPTLDRRRLFFRDVPLPWRRWVQWWENPSSRSDTSSPLPEPVRLLPELPESSMS